MSVATAEGGMAGEQSDVGRVVRAGAGWGAVGAFVMALYAMVAAATYLNVGFFTPMYHIASTFISPNTMMTSMEHAMKDQLFHFSFGPAVLGMIIHLAVGAAYGIVFALLARALNLAGAVAVVGGAIYGIVVLLFSSFVSLPIAAAVFGGGDPIADMPELVGWTFTVEHVMYGIVLGLGWLSGHRATTARAAPARAAT